MRSFWMAYLEYVNIDWSLGLVGLGKGTHPSHPEDDGG